MRRALPVWTGLGMMGWLTVVLWLDQVGGGVGAWQQRGLGALTWAVLVVALWRVAPEVRAATVVVVAFATVVEYVFSPTLGVYTYRLHNVPAFVPPGHGLVYLSAIALGHARMVERHRRTAVVVVLVAAGTWAAHGVLVADRPDALGAFWAACLAGFLLFGPSRPVYLGAFVVVSWLEVVGTSLGTWVWATHDPTGLVTIGNPPSGAAGGYGWFDLAGLLAAPHLLAAWERVSPRSARRAAAAPADGR
ncbi:MAG TPA: hypothetical protein VER39_08165 [Nocardioidaceae bacterium]|nr:hypothetical protein [Nocardioidaceae bacterium]